MKCPGRIFSMLSDPSRCESEQWTIHTYGKECGEPLEHLDLVYFKYCFQNNCWYKMGYNHNNKNIWSADSIKSHTGYPGTYFPRLQFILFKDGHENIYNW